MCLLYTLAWLQPPPSCPYMDIGTVSSYNGGEEMVEKKQMSRYQLSHTNLHIYSTGSNTVYQTTYHAQRNIVVQVIMHDFLVHVSNIKKLYSV